MAEPDIVAFIEARLAEDETLARAVEGHQLFDGTGIIVMKTHLDIHTRSVTLPSHVATYAMRFDPARVLAEIAAKRRILGRHCPASSPDHVYRERIPIYMCVGCGYETSYGCTQARTPDINDCPELRDLAATWNTHPDYNQAWGTDG